MLAAVGLLAGSLFVRIHADSRTVRAISRQKVPTPVAIAASTPTPAPQPSLTQPDRLRVRQLVIPVEGYDLHRLQDTFHDARIGHLHRAIDLMAPRGTPVRAADEGTIARLSHGLLGGIAVYAKSPDGRYCYYYAHLDRYAPLLREGQSVRKGEILGYVGSSGNAMFSSPHLHFAIYQADRPDDVDSCAGKAINPYPLLALAERAAS